MAQPPQMADRCPIEIKGKDGIQTVHATLTIVSEGGNAGNEHATDLILTRTRKEFERALHGSRVVDGSIVVAHRDDIRL
jgi:hypothetical protein